MFVATNTIIIILISTLLIFILYKFIFNKNKKITKNSILIIGPSESGKTTFFYYLIENPNIKTIMSMQINELKDHQIKFLNNKHTIIDVPGTGYYKDFIMNKLNETKLLLLFINSTDKNSIVQSSEYLYDILNSDKFNDEINIIICCNKQDENFPKSKKMIENELEKEIDNLKNIKQKNNLDDNVQIGTLFHMKSKFNFKMFNNVEFIECDKKSEYNSLIKRMKEILENKNIN
jgi:signal recognition particle receptor subunit beta